MTSNTPTNHELIEALKKAAKREITPREKWLQMVSFVYGNLALDNPNITREMVERHVVQEYGPCPD